MAVARRLKIITGLILFAFVTVHLVNLAIGFFSLPLAEKIRPALLFPFTNTIGSYVLGASALLHMSLGVQALYNRNTLQMTRHDSVQLVTALLIPPLLIPHAWVLIANHKLLGIAAGYFDIFQHYWITEPLSGLRQVLLVMVIWIHGCIGLLTWLRIKPWWPRVSVYVYPIAVMIPVLALLAFVEGGKRVLGASGVDPAGNYQEPLNPEHGQGANRSQTTAQSIPGSSYGGGYEKDNGESVGSYGAVNDDESSAYESDYGAGGAYGSSYQSDDASNQGGAYSDVEDAESGRGYGDYGGVAPPATDPEEIRTTREFIQRVKWRIIFAYLGLLLVVLAARALRLRGNNQTVEVHYANGEVLTRPVGLSLLEISNINDMPHASLCRGRGRCGTCRVRIYSTESELDPPVGIERETLARTGGGENVRLACQLKPGPGVIAIERLLPADVQEDVYTDKDDPEPRGSTAAVAEQP